MNSQASNGDVNTYRDRFIINTAALLRSLGVGLMGVVLGIYLSRLGYSALGIGVVVAIGLVGSAIATALVGVAADRIGRKRFLVTLSLLTALGGLGLYASVNFPLLLVFAAHLHLGPESQLAPRRKSPSVLCQCR